MVTILGKGMSQVKLHQGTTSSHFAIPTKWPIFASEVFCRTVAQVATILQTHIDTDRRKIAVELIESVSLTKKQNREA